MNDECMEPQGDLAVGIAVGSAFTVRRAGALCSIDGSVRDAAARLCDLSSDVDHGGVRCDAKMYPLCKDTHTLVPPTGRTGAGPGAGAGTAKETAPQVGHDPTRVSFAGYRVVGDAFRGLGPLRRSETAAGRHAARVPASVPYFGRREGASERGGKSRGRVGGAAGRVLSEFLG